MVEFQPALEFIYNVGTSKFKSFMVSLLPTTVCVPYSSCRYTDKTLKNKSPQPVGILLEDHSPWTEGFLFLDWSGLLTLLAERGGFVD